MTLRLRVALLLLRLTSKLFLRRGYQVLVLSPETVAHFAEQALAQKQAPVSSPTAFRHGDAGYL